MAQETPGEENPKLVCPLNPTWVAKMLAVLPPGNRGKLAKYIECASVKKMLAELELEKEG